MNPIAAFGVVAGIASLAGLVLGIRSARRATQRVKRLVFEMEMPPIPIASGTSLRDYNLSIIHKSREGVAREIDDAYAQYLRFANLGRDPIRRDDIAPENPLRIEIAAAEILDVALVAVTRPVSNISVESPVREGDTWSVLVEFDFLDFKDGGVIRMLTSSHPDSVSLVGDIIGMPAGVKAAADVRSRDLLSVLGVAVSVLFELAALALTPFVFRWVMGSWRNVWVLALPLVALFVPLIVSLVISDTIWPHSGPLFPHQLGLPAFVRWRGVQLGWGLEMFDPEGDLRSDYPGRSAHTDNALDRQGHKRPPSAE